MNIMGEIAGIICKTVLPIPEDIVSGNPLSNVAVCTLSSMNLLRDIGNSTIMERCAIAGRLLSENKGIDALVRHINENPRIDTLILCGKEVPGHRAGHALVCLHRDGIDESGRIVNCISPDPILLVSVQEVKRFQEQTKILNRIGLTDVEEIARLI